MKKTFYITLIAIMLSSLLFTSCDLFGANEDDSADVNTSEKIEYDDFDDPALDNEADGAEPIKVSHKEKDFYGSWAATSEQAKHLFGNVELRINEDGSWSGNITEEKFSGKWKYDGSGLILKDSGGLINWNVYYVTDGTLMFRDLNDPEVDLVLKKK